MFDCSEYPGYSNFYYAINKKLKGKMKDKIKGSPIVEFIGLRAKRTHS